MTKVKQHTTADIRHPTWSEAERDAWRPQEDVNVWQWADANRRLPASSALPGSMYRSDHVPYMREPQEMFTVEEAEIIVLMAAAQVTKTTTMTNMLGFCIDRDPGPAGWVVPTEKAVSEASQAVCKPMVMDSPVLRGHWSGNPRDISLLRHVLDSMTVNFMWAGSPTALAMRAIRYLFIDEPDKFPGFAGREANPIDLAIARATTFWDAKVVIACTPTTPDGQVAIWYEKSNRKRVYCPCPHCGEYEVWKFTQLKCPKTLRDPDEIISSGDVWCECLHCSYKIREEVKPDLVAAHKWLAEGESIDADGNIRGKPNRSRRISGYQISALVSPFPRVTWSRILANWFESNTAEGIAAGALMHFHNTILGEAHVETGRRLKAKDLHRLTGGFGKGTVPDGCLMLVVGADYHETQRGVVRIDWEVRGFAYGCKNWLIASGWSPSFADFEEAVLLSPFPWSDGTQHEDKPFLAVICGFIDAKFKAATVYNYCATRRGLIFPLNGLPGPCKTPVRFAKLEEATRIDLTARQKKLYRGMLLAEVDTHFFKDAVTSWVTDMLDEDGAITAPALTQFYNEVPSFYFRDFTNEQKVRTINKKTGAAKYTWQPVSKGAQTHCLDTAVYAAAAAYYKQAFFMKDPKKKTPPAAGQRRRRRVRRVGKVQRY